MCLFTTSHDVIFMTFCIAACTKLLFRFREIIQNINAYGHSLYFWNENFFSFIFVVSLHTFVCYFYVFFFKNEIELCWFVWLCSTPYEYMNHTCMVGPYEHKLVWVFTGWTIWVFISYRYFLNCIWNVSIIHKTLNKKKQTIMVTWECLNFIIQRVHKH